MSISLYNQHFRFVNFIRKSTYFLAKPNLCQNIVIDQICMDLEDIIVTRADLRQFLLKFWKFSTTAGCHGWNLECMFLG